MDENVILQLFIAFKDDLVPKEARNPEGICEAYKHFKEIARQVFTEKEKTGSKKDLSSPRRPKNYSDIITKNF